MSNTATVYSRAWYGDEELTLNFPTGWEVEILGPKDAPELSDAQIEKIFAEPIGTPRIAELAKGKKSAAIVVDDLSRPTPAANVIPFLLRELASAGVPKSEIRFVVGGGSHRPLTDEEVAKKIGADVAAAYQATSHDFMSGDLRALGSLDNGMPIYLNRVVADADFKVCLGGIYHTVPSVSAAVQNWSSQASRVSRRCSISTLSHPAAGMPSLKRRGTNPIIEISLKRLRASSNLM